MIITVHSPCSGAITVQCNELAAVLVEQKSVKKKVGTLLLTVSRGEEKESINSFHFIYNRAVFK